MRKKLNLLFGLVLIISMKMCIRDRYGAYAEQDFDGSWLLSLILGGGGGK